MSILMEARAAKETLVLVVTGRELLAGVLKQE